MHFIKSLLTLLALALTVTVATAQSFTPPRSSSSITVQDSRYRALLNFYMTHTHGLTLNGGLDTLGAMLYEDSSGHVWYRDTIVSGGHKWTYIPKSTDIIGNNGLSNSASAIVMGQDVGASGNPAQLLSSREIPFNGFGIDKIDLLNTSAVQSHIKEWTIDSVGQLMPIDVIARGNGSDVPGDNQAFFHSWTPVNYGVTYTSPYSPIGTVTQDKWTLGYSVSPNGDPGAGGPDNVLNFGYNTTANGGRRSPLDASWRYGYEGNFLGEVGGVSLDFEFHQPEITALNNKIYRLNSYYVNKVFGYTRNERFIDDNQYFSTGDSSTYPGVLYAQLFAGAFQGLGCAPVLNMYGSGNFADHECEIAFNSLLTGDQFLFRQRASTTMYMGFNGLPGIGIDAASNIVNNVNGNNNTNRGVTMIGVFPSFTGVFNPDAILQIYSTEQGVLLPAMTTDQQNAIHSGTPTDGLTLFNNEYNANMTYNGAGWVSNSIVTQADLSGQTAGATINTFAVPAGTGASNFRVGGYVTITAVTTDVAQLQVSWTDETSTVRTQNFFPVGTTSADLSATGAITFPSLDIRAKKGTTVTQSVILTVSSGSIAYDAGGTVIFLN